MNIEISNIITGVLGIIYAEIEKDRDFVEKSKSWIFIISQPNLMVLRASGSEFVDMHMPTGKDVIMGYRIIGVYGIEDNELYFGKKYEIGGK